MCLFIIPCFLVYFNRYNGEDGDIIVHFTNKYYNI